LKSARLAKYWLDDPCYLLRTDLTGVAHIAFKAVGLRPPPLAQRNATGRHGVTAAAMEDCGAGRATVAMPYKVVHGASDVAVGQRGYS
jgi:hypothetical protein